MHPQYGFLLPRTANAPKSSPLAHQLGRLEALTAALPTRTATGEVRDRIQRLPLLDTALLKTADDTTLEDLLMYYGYLASAYVFGEAAAVTRLPATLAVPLAAVARLLQRPPMLAYASTVLNNCRLRDPSKEISVDNVDVRVRLTDLPDEAWFFRIHMAIEARAGEILLALQAAINTAPQRDYTLMFSQFRQVERGLNEITRIFHRMGEACDSDVYYQRVRPFLNGFSGVIFEDVPELAGQPQHFRGASGAQSSIVPAVLAGLGVAHSHNDLTQHLDAMRAYMPLAHRRYIEALDGQTLRAACIDYAPLRDAYNTCLRQLMIFRRAHLYYARTYIFEKTTNPTGTGGTEFMDFLGQLIEETQAHLL